MSLGDTSGEATYQMDKGGLRTVLSRSVMTRTIALVRIEADERVLAAD